MLHCIYGKLFPILGKTALVMVLPYLLHVLYNGVTSFNHRSKVHQRPFSISMVQCYKYMKTQISVNKRKQVA